MRTPWPVLAASTAVALVAGACASTEEADELADWEGDLRHEYVSRPDLGPPVVQQSVRADTATEGYVFFSPRKSTGDYADDDPRGGLLIVDDEAEPVWMDHYEDETFANDFDVQTFQGETVLTYWEGETTGVGYGEGDYVILDDAYEEVARVQAGDDLVADFHDLVITDRDTALLVAYPLHEDLEHEGHPIVSGAFQEVDIETGEVLFEWDATDHVDYDDSVQPLPEDEGDTWDYFHINSVAQNEDGDYLISARHTHAIYKIDGDSGDILWTLGGASSDFDVEGDAGFGWQHDARFLESDDDQVERISLLDNVSGSDDADDGPSRALVLDLDHQDGTAGIVNAFENPDLVPSGTQASHQNLPNGNSFAGWGSQPSFTEFGTGGEVLRHAYFPGTMYSYRAKVHEWTGQPETPPDAVLEDGTVYVSWNGATEVASWRVVTEDDETVAEADRDGFETALEIDADDPAASGPFVVEALDADGEVLGSSDPVEA